MMKLLENIDMILGNMPVVEAKGSGPLRRLKEHLTQDDAQKGLDLMEEFRSSFLEWLKQNPEPMKTISTLVGKDPESPNFRDYLFDFLMGSGVQFCL